MTMGAVSTRGVWGRHSSSGKNFRDGRKVLGEEETIPSFVFLPLSSGEGTQPWWKEVAFQHHLALAHKPRSDQRLCRQHGHWGERG